MRFIFESEIDGQGFEIFSCFISLKGSFFSPLIFGNYFFASTSCAICFGYENIPSLKWFPDGLKLESCYWILKSIYFFFFSGASTWWYCSLAEEKNSFTGDPDLKAFYPRFEMSAKSYFWNKILNYSFYDMSVIIWIVHILELSLAFVVKLWSWIACNVWIFYFYFSILISESFWIFSGLFLWDIFKRCCTTKIR